MIKTKEKFQRETEMDSKESRNNSELSNDEEVKSRAPVRNRVFTIPNILSIVRLIIAPFIFYTYVCLGLYKVSAILVIVSGLTDAADGYIARNYNQISDVGKVLDPIADKVTQVIMFACLITRYKLMKVLTVVLIVKELVQAIFVFFAFKKINRVEGSKWFGKISTIILYIVCISLMIFPNMPVGLANSLMYLCLVMISIAFLGYLKESLGFIFSSRKA